MKRLMALMASVFIVLALFACGGGGGDGSSTTAEGGSSTIAEEWSLAGNVQKCLRNFRR